MSYCRFENTARDLIDCEEALLDFRDLSESERAAAIQLIDTAKRIAFDYGHFSA
jgi:hypothetical protein